MEEVDTDLNDYTSEFEDMLYELDDYINEGTEEEEEESGIYDQTNIDIIEAQKKSIEENKRRENVETDKLKKWQDTLYPDKKIYRSVLLEYFPVDLCIELDRVSRGHYNDNNTKQKRMCELLDEYEVPYSILGPGTNRYGILVDQYCVKIAFDKDGKIDNKREFIYSLALQPYVVKTYECSETGLLSVCEYVQSFELHDFGKHWVQAEMRKILKDIASKFLIGDVGLTSVNYANWGFRDDGSICILDYAYIYSVSYKQFTCSCDNTSILYYDTDFVNLICPSCGKKYSFSQLRKKISKKDQDEEIGDLLKKGYVMTKPEQKLPFNHKFVLGATDEIMKKVYKEEKKEKDRSSFGNTKTGQDWGSEEDKKMDMDDLINLL